MVHLLRTPCRSTWRKPAAAVALVALLAHLPVTGPHLDEVPYLGAAFVVLEVALAALAVLLVLSDTAAVWGAVGLTSASALLAYAASRTVGLPGAEDDVGNWGEPLGVVSISAEGTLLLLALLHRHGAPSLLHLGPGALGVLLLVVGGTAVVSAQTLSPSAMDVHRTMPTAGHAAAHRMDGSYWAAVAGGPAPSGTVRRYYVSADPVVWDYAPGKINQITDAPFDEDAAVFVGSGPGRVGSRYVKCLYRSYSDATFEERVPRRGDEKHLGTLGPVIRAEVGDTIKVVFRNACPFPTGMHPHGVFYDKSNEGAQYADGTSGTDKLDDSVPTGHRHTYVWKVPTRAGPGPGDGSSVMWMYHGHTDEVTDTYAGLLGPMVVTARGRARPDGSPRDVDREVFAMFFVDDENQSPLLPESMRRLGTPPFPEDLGDEEFVESNLMHSINGYVFGTMPMVTLQRGDHVRWYVMGMGTEVDLHTPHWHGNDVVVMGMRMDVVSLLPGSMVVADMVPDDPGTWLFHCHVADHIAAGMLARYRVE